MEFQLEKPDAVMKAQERQKGMNIILEILVFLVVFVVCTIGQVLCMIPGQMLMLTLNTDYQSAAAAGDMARLNEVAMEIASSDIFVVSNLFATIAMTAVVLLFCRLIQKRKPDTLGFTRKGAGKEYLIGLGVGFGMFSAAVLLCVVTGAIRIEGLSGTFSVGIFLLFTVGFIIQGMGEEVLCRGYVMVSVGRRYPMWVAVFTNAMIFAVLHLLNNGISVLAFINLVLFGVFASLYFIKRGNIWRIGALHSVWNLVQGNFWGLSVSGMGTKCSVFSSTMIEGKSIINGGAFGPEGGLGVSVVLLVGICVLLSMKSVNHRSISLE